MTCSSLRLAPVRNETILKIGKNGHYAFAKCLVWVKNENCLKQAKNDSTCTLELVVPKNTALKNE